MPLDPDIALFLASPVMIIVGTASAAGRPEIGRAIGALVAPETRQLDLVLSRWQWPTTVENVQATGRLAATFARPSDYVSYQVKGAAALVPASPAHLAGAARYLDAIAATLDALGLERRISAAWRVERDPVVLRCRIEAVFVQTPGAKAGQPL
jgi:hypothetical protein